MKDMKEEKIISKVKDIAKADALLTQEVIDNNKCFQLGDLAFIANGLFRYLVYLKTDGGSYLLSGVLYNTVDSDGKAVNDFEYYEIIGKNSKMLNKLTENFKMLEKYFTKPEDFKAKDNKQ